MLFEEIDYIAAGEELFGEIFDADAEAEAEFVSMKPRSRRGDRRKVDLKKARRKARIDIARSCDGYPMYDNLHQYSKNKIHCSCRLCRGKDYFGRHITTEQEIRSADEMAVELAEILEEEKGA